MLQKGNRMAYDEGFGYVLYKDHVRVGCVGTMAEAEEFVYDEEDE